MYFVVLWHKITLKLKSPKICIFFLSKTLRNIIASAMVSTGPHGPLCHTEKRDHCHFMSSKKCQLSQSLNDIPNMAHTAGFTFFFDELCRLLVLDDE